MPVFKYIFDRFVVTEIDIIAFLQYYAISNAMQCYNKDIYDTSTVN